MHNNIIIATLLASLLIMTHPFQSKSQVRPAAVAGQFYSGDATELAAQIDGWLASASRVVPQGLSVRAVIVPHAGYVFSGQVAAEAFAQIADTDQYDRIILLGPSHYVALQGASVDAGYSACATPLGEVPIDTAVCHKLLTHKIFSYVPDAHDREHCLEVQLPMLQRRLGKHMPPIVPIVIGTERLPLLRELAQALRSYYDEGRSLFVISSDFSHYPRQADAVVADSATARAIGTGRVQTFLDALATNELRHMPGLVTSACGQCAIATLMLITQGQEGVRYRHLAYRNSGDSSWGDQHRVVGYNAFVVTAPAAGSDFISLTAKHKRLLLEIARHSIEARLMRKSYRLPASLPQAVQQHCGAFVTLHNPGGSLRGCIGLLRSDEPLASVAAQMAQAAALRDPRFEAVDSSELPFLKIEISVLTPLRRIGDVSEFVPGRDGIYLVKDGRSGTFLPQVANETGWNAEQMLGHCARDKAGLRWDDWRSAELYTYRAIVFSEP